MEQRLKYPSGNVGNLSRLFLPWLDREYLIDLVRRQEAIGIQRTFYFALAHALSRHRDREAWKLIKELGGMKPIPVPLSGRVDCSIRRRG